MLSPTFSSRRAPPIRPSQSLEGLEQVVPPKLMYFTPHRSDIFIDKPLPARPMPDDEIEYSAMWSDSSSDYDSESESGSTLESLASPSSPSEPRRSTDAYPIFVSSGSSEPDELVEDLDDLPDLNHDDIDDLVAPSVPADQVSLGSILETSPPRTMEDGRTDSIDLDASSIILGANAHYGRPLQWSQHQNDSNHYFRDKTWHFFPELAAPSSRAPAGRANSTSASSKARKEGRLNVSARRRRWYSLDRAHMGRPNGVRDSIKTYVSKTLSREGPEDKSRSTRPVTSPVDPMLSSRSLASNAIDGPRPSPGLEIDTQLANMSLTAITPHPYENPRASPTTPKNLAVPLSPYQRFGPSIWEHPSDKPHDNVVVVPASQSPSTSPQFSSATAIPSPLKIHLQQNTRGAVRALQGSTIQMRGALGNAKKKERRREELKSQIRLVGTVNPHTYGKADPWSPA